MTQEVVAVKLAADLAVALKDVIEYGIEYGMAMVAAARVEAGRVEAARVEAARVEAATKEAARVEAAAKEAAQVEAAMVVMMKEANLRSQEQDKIEAMQDAALRLQALPRLRLEGLLGCGGHGYVVRCPITPLCPLMPCTQFYLPPHAQSLDFRA